MLPGQTLPLEGTAEQACLVQLSPFLMKCWRMLEESLLNQLRSSAAAIGNDPAAIGGDRRRSEI
jgi:hypothetical protein